MVDGCAQREMLALGLGATYNRNVLGLFTRLFRVVGAGSL